MQVFSPLLLSGPDGPRPRGGRLSLRAAAAAAAFLVASPAPAGAWAQQLLFDDLRTALPPETRATRAVDLGDVDGDGVLDALVGNGPSTGAASAANQLYLGLGTGSFVEHAPGLPAVGSEANTRSVRLFDADGDGDLDAAIGNAGPDELLLGDGGGGFVAAPGGLPALDGDTADLAAADLDGDGDRDLVLAMGDSSELENRLYRNDGGGSFALAAGALPAHVQASRSVDLGDADGDGDLDVLVGNGLQPFISSENRLYFNDGAGSFAELAGAFPPRQGETMDLRFGDLDADGDLDAFVGETGVNLLHVNDGTGTFGTDFPAVLDVFTMTRRVAVADFTGDGKVDVLVGNAAVNELFANGAVTSLGALAVAESTAALAAGDLDGDGDLDAFAGNGLLSAVPDRVYRNDGAGGFPLLPGSLPVLAAATRGVALGDLDGDGFPDALLADGQIGVGLPNELLLNRGDGTLADASGQLPAHVDRSSAVALGDVDGDGDLDAYLASDFFGSPDRVYRNLGGAVFQDVPGAVLGPVGRTLDLALGDLDGDGNLDVFVANDFFQQNRLRLGNGGGGFLDATSVLVPPLADSTADVELGDIDGDGDLDVYLAERLGEQDRLLENTGGGLLVDATAQLPAESGSTEAAVLADLDGDGDLDVLQGGQPAPGDSANRLFLNQGGTLSFVDASAGLPFQAEATFDLAAADLDGDGDPDVLVATAGQELALRNDGPGLFADAPSWLPPVADHTFAVAVADLDLDGDADALLGNLYGNRVLTGLRRQLAWRDVPAVAKPLALDLFAEPGAPWLLGLDLAAAAPAPLPPLGILHLDPANLAIAGSGALDGLGRATPTFAVPAGPALVGLAAFWQSALGSPLALSNLEITTLSGL